MSTLCEEKIKDKTEDKQETCDAEESRASLTKSVLPEASKVVENKKIIKNVKNKKSRSPDCEQASKKAKYDTDLSSARLNVNLSSDLKTPGSIERSSDVSDAKTVKDNTVLVADHYNALQENNISQRNKSRIVYMRNFNNWIKSMLINEYMAKVKQNKTHGSPLRVLDMCCGKGGDLLKWRKANISHLICADIAQVSLEQCQQRYNDMKNRNNGRDHTPTAEFIMADCTKVHLRQKFKDPSMQLDLVNCQFAFHYSFESLPQAECMLRNASESLSLGGYFIGTIPDTYDLVSRWQKCDGNKFGNDIFSIEFLCEDKTKPPFFGAKYNFHLDGVVNCPEFLVYLPVLCKLAQKYNLKLVTFERFDAFYERFKNEGKGLLRNMQALETYPPNHETPLLGDSKRDYQHAIKYMQNLPANHHIGTLSQSEWEVTSLYAVFAFQKIKTT